MVLRVRRYEKDDMRTQILKFRLFVLYSKRIGGAPNFTVVTEAEHRSIPNDEQNNRFNGLFSRFDILYVFNGSCPNR